MDKAFEIALSYNITVYDALYITQTLHHNKPQLTLDQKTERSSKQNKYKEYHLKKTTPPGYSQFSPL
ncbi:MAG: hypothetical protein QXE66_06970 [Desulfurococcaceae archaeon]